MVQRLQVDGDDGRHVRRDLAHVVDAHDDGTALEELGAAGVHDRDAGTVAGDRLLDTLVPDGVTDDVQVVEKDAADGGERLGDAAGPVSSGRPRDADSVPVRRLVDGACVEAETAEEAERRAVASRNPTPDADGRYWPDPAISGWDDTDEPSVVEVLEVKELLAEEVV